MAQQPSEWEVLSGVGTKKHTVDTELHEHMNKLDRCKRTWIYANAYAYIMSAYILADMWIQKKKKRRSFILHKPWENYGESQLAPQLANWVCLKMGLIFPMK